MSRTDLDTWEEKQATKRRKKDGGGEVAFVTKLGAAKNALALAQEIPDFADLIENAEAVRAAAKALHISAEGINAWTRFVVDAERKAWKRIEEMRKAGELKAKSGGLRDKSVMVLADLIENRATKRASEWSALAKLTEFQLNECERIANEEDRILSRNELIQLSKAGTPTGSKAEKTRSTEDLAYITRALERAEEEGYQGDDIQIHEDAKIEKMERGGWVEAWVWVEDPLAQSDVEE
jgi:hypothetical protein